MTYRGFANHSTWAIWYYVLEGDVYAVEIIRRAWDRRENSADALKAYVELQVAGQTPNTLTWALVACCMEATDWRELSARVGKKEI